MKEITNEKMQELMENQEFAAKVRSAKTAEEMVKIFAEYDVEITEEELRDSCKQTVDVLREQGYMEGDELTESGLEMVAGGAKWGRALCGVGIMGGSMGLVAMGAVCPPLGAAMLVCGGIGAVCSILTR